jgi:hypothetical protein
MVDRLGKIPKMAIAISPAIFILILMLIIFSVSMHRGGQGEGGRNIKKRIGMKDFIGIIYWKYAQDYGG